MISCKLEREMIKQKEKIKDVILMKGDDAAA